MLRLLLRLVGLAALGGLGWLLTAPTRVKAVRWEGLPPAPPRDAGVYADNGQLAPFSLFARPPGLSAPESTAVDAQGRIYTGFGGGAVLRFSEGGQTWEKVAETGGRPLGLRFHPGGDLLIADAERGLLRCTPQGQVTVLTTEADGVRLGFTDDLDVDRAGRFVYFTDASSKYGFEEVLPDLLEHGGHGRVLRHDLQTGQTDTLRSGLNFPNGVTLSPDETALLVTETGTASIHRLWLSGDRRGTWEVFAQNLPGYPDNIRHDGALYWVALPQRRSPLIDASAPYPMVREMIARLTSRVKVPLPEEAMLLALNEHGQPVAYATDSRKAAYSYITQVLPHGEELILSSLHQSTVARISRSAVVRP